MTPENQSDGPCVDARPVASESGPSRLRVRRRSVRACARLILRRLRRLLARLSGPRRHHLLPVRSTCRWLHPAAITVTVAITAVVSVAVTVAARTRLSEGFHISMTELRATGRMADCHAGTEAQAEREDTGGDTSTENEPPT